LQTKQKFRQNNSIGKWQEKLLPMMSFMILSLTIFFFAATCVQLINLNEQISSAPDFTLSPIHSNNVEERLLSNLTYKT
jgi:hypothetical protein